jgi:hypothetical protein
MEVGKNILEVTEEKWLRWFGHVKRMPGNRLPLKILEWEPDGTRRRGRPKDRVLMGKPEGKRPLGRSRHRWEDGIRMDLRETGWGSVDWIQLAQDRDRWRALVNMVMKLRVLAPQS